MQFRGEAILCALRQHGENGGILRLLTRDHGLISAYANGAKGRELRPVLIPGNRLAVELRSRNEAQLPNARVELVASVGPWLGEPLANAAIGWITALTASSLPEGHHYPRLYAALGALLDAVCLAPAARSWAGALQTYEALLLRELGFGMDEAAQPGLRGGFSANGTALSAHLFADRRADVMAARVILLHRLDQLLDDGVDL